MQLTQSAALRMDQRQTLTPRMIQSMEILQMPLALLEERIEQEMEQNPILELKERRGDADDIAPSEPELDNRELDVSGTDEGGAEDFERLDRISEYLENEEFSRSNDLKADLSHGPSMSSYAGERDAKLDAMANTAERVGNLTDHLLDQWRLTDYCEGDPNVTDDQRSSICTAGAILISYLDDRGYLTQGLQEVADDAVLRGRGDSIPDQEAFERAFELIRRHLEPAGVGATSLQDCLQLQLTALERDDELAEGHDFPLERDLIGKHLKDLELNRYPQLSKKTGKSIDELKAAVKRLSRLHPHPGKLIAADEAPPITPDATIRYDEDSGEYVIEMARDPSSDLKIRTLYRKMLKQVSRKKLADVKKGDVSVDDRRAMKASEASVALAAPKDAKEIRDFLSNNLRSAKWLIESIEQRAGTIERVIRKVVEHQRPFFEKGPEFLRPLPMIQVADELGIHVATVSRAVNEKWVDTPRGVFPLRRFFSGGTITEDGTDMSWDAVKEKLRVIVENEDKTKPLSDDAIVTKLEDQGIDLARRTVAKYRKLLGIPTARQRREY